MDTENIEKSKSKSKKKIFLKILAILLLVMFISGIYIYRNFNQIISKAIVNSFNSNVISNVYELKFEKLRINFFTGNIKIVNLILQPRKIPLQNYSYINSSIKLETKKILLEDIQIIELIKTGKVNLKSIEIFKPNIEIGVSGVKFVLFPYADTTSVSDLKNKSTDKFVNSFFLNQFALIDASIQIKNSTKMNEFKVQKLSISLNELRLNQQSGKNLISIDNLGLHIENVYGRIQKGALRSFGVKSFNLLVENLDIQESPDTFQFHFNNFETAFKNLDVNTSDSIFNLSVNSMALSYASKSLKLKDISYQPNITQKELLKREKYQKVLVSLSLGTMDILNVNFDSLVYSHKLFIDDIKVDKLKVTAFKDKTKPIDTKRFPQYLGQKIMKIPIPLKVKSITVVGVELENTERKVDGNLAKVVIDRGKLEIKNLTNLNSAEFLTLHASAYLEKKVLFTLGASFSYQKQFITFNAKAGKFDFTELNQLLTAYTPAKIKNGIVDDIAFSGTANSTGARGSMKALFHNMDIDLEISDRKWVNSFLTFSANSIVISNNPSSPEKPPRIVEYQIDRNMNKGSINVMLLSILAGTKETFIMSKENKKAYKENKKLWKQQGQ